MHVFGPLELATDVQNNGHCIGCGACVELCPYFRNHQGRTVQLFPCALSQGRCYASCPKAEVDLDAMAKRYWGQPYEDLPIGRIEEALAAKAGPKMPEGPYQGGGAVSALVVEAMKRGFVEATVLTGQDENGPVPVLAANIREVITCASSKFGAAPTLAALNRAVTAGHRNLGVVGTPCQVTSLAKMRTIPPMTEGFIDPVSFVIGLFCNWSLDQRNLKAYLAGLTDLSRIKGVDIPPPPANIMRVDLGNELLEIPLDRLRPFIPETCSLCPDMTSEWADLSVGMYEGRPGWNTLLIRTPKGRELVEKAVSSGMLSTEPMPSPNLEHLRSAAGTKKRRAFYALWQRGLLNTSGPEKRAMFRVPHHVLKKMMDNQNGGNNV